MHKTACLPSRPLYSTERQIVFKINKSYSRVGSVVNFAALFFEVAWRQPGTPAVTEGDIAWTYGDLVERVGRIACSLREDGCNHGDRVVLWMENCAEMLELMLACWTAGLCIVPVNARLHPREVAHIITNSGARLLLTTPGPVSEAAAVSAAQQDPAKIICVKTEQYDRLLGARSIEACSGRTQRPRVDILYQRNNWAAEGRDAQSSGPGIHEHLLSLRC